MLANELLRQPNATDLAQPFWHGQCRRARLEIHRETSVAPQDAPSARFAIAFARVAVAPDARVLIVAELQSATFAVGFVDHTSVFPSAAASNPTSNIISLALRLSRTAFMMISSMVRG